MTRPTSKIPVAGGALLAISVVAGALIGTALGQATIGMLAGTAVGFAAVLAVWLADRRR